MKLSQIFANPSEFYTEAEVCNALRKSIPWAQRHRWAGTGIPYVKIGRSVRYRGVDVAAWVDNQRVSTAEADGTHIAPLA